MNDYIGIPYKSNGRDRDGLDCYGLVYLFEKEVFGKSLPSLDGVYSGDNATELIQEQKPLIVGELTTNPKDGDIVLFFHAGKPTHVGVYWQRGVLHAIERHGVVYERMNSTYLKRFQKKEYYHV